MSIDTELTVKQLDQMVEEVKSQSSKVDFAVPNIIWFCIRIARLKMNKSNFVNI